MRSLSLLVFVLLLLGCESEPSFDERYEAAEREIRKTAAEIDAELQNRAEEARETNRETAPESVRPGQRKGL